MPSKSASKGYYASSLVTATFDPARAACVRDSGTSLAKKSCMSIERR